MPKGNKKQRHNITLSQLAWELLRLVGNGNRSRAIEWLAQEWAIRNKLAEKEADDGGKQE